MIFRKIDDIYLKVIPFRNHPDRNCFGSSKLSRFQIRQVLSCPSAPDLECQMRLHIFKERHQGRYIRRTGADLQPSDILGLHCMLQVISRFQLAVQHCVLFQSHEGRIMVCFGIAVPVTADVELRCIFFQFIDIGFQPLYGSLDRCLLFAATRRFDPCA